VRQGVPIRKIIHYKAIGKNQVYSAVQSVGAARDVMRRMRTSKNYTIFFAFFKATVCEDFYVA
jgi:hypothetical protein